MANIKRKLVHRLVVVRRLVGFWDRIVPVPLLVIGSRYVHFYQLEYH